MYKLEEFESMLRNAAAENATVGIIFKGKRLNSTKAQELQTAHHALLRTDPAYRDLFDSYKSNYLKLNDIVTRIESRTPDFKRNAPILDQCKGIAVTAFQMATLAVRLPQAAIASVLEDKAARKMFRIYTDKTLD